jgi:hypothetical protein
MGPKRSAPRRFAKENGIAANCRSGYRYVTDISDVMNNRWFVTKRRVVFHPKWGKVRKLEMRARVGQCVPPGQKRVARMDEKLRKITLKKRQKFAADNVWNNPDVQKRFREIEEEEAARRRAAAAAARRAARAPKQMVTRGQAQPRRSIRLKGG